MLRSYGNNVAGESCSFPDEEAASLVKRGVAEPLEQKQPEPPPTAPATPRAKAKQLVGPPEKTALDSAPKEK